MAWTGGTRGGGTVGVGREAGIEWSGSSGGLETMGFSKRKQITAAWPPLAASIKMLELSCGNKRKQFC